MRKRLMMLLVVGVLGVGVAPTASADTFRVAQDTTTETDDESEGTDYGWIGLLGLAGLAGLLGRKRRDEVVQHPRGRADTTRDR